MVINKKTGVTLFALAITALLLIFFVITPIFEQIVKESENLIIQKNKIAEAEAKIKNIQDFTANFKQYQTDLEKIDRLFVDISEPIEFIEFLESEAAFFQLSIGIAPPVLRKREENIRQALEFGLNLKGSFPNFSRFLETLEVSPYLIEPLNLSIIKLADEESTVSVSLSIRVYAK